ncbi:hypothetical protein [Pseudomonas sp. Irchel 3A5]|nr:hypothetical protein [Pseudomonas sp. Irchel 3A5]
MPLPTNRSGLWILQAKRQLESFALAAAMDRGTMARLSTEIF